MTGRELFGKPGRGSDEIESSEEDGASKWASLCSSVKDQARMAFFTPLSNSLGRWLSASEG